MIKSKWDHAIEVELAAVKVCVCVRERDREYQRLCFLEEIGDESGRFGRFFGREEFRSEVPENDHAYDSCEAEPSLRLLLPPLRCLAAFNCCRRRRHLRRRERERKVKKERNISDGIEVWTLILRVWRYMRWVLVKGKKKKGIILELGGHAIFSTLFMQITVTLTSLAKYKTT